MMEWVLVLLAVVACVVGQTPPTGTQTATFPTESTSILPTTFGNPCGNEIEWECKDGGCIDVAWVCDNEEDCIDGSDEVNCDEFICSEYGLIECNTTATPGPLGTYHAKCIVPNWKCDGFIDCPMGTDELNCFTDQCADDEWMCPAGECIPQALVCNYQEDCEQGGDEGGDCPYPTCTSEDFVCGSGQCVPSAAKCDENFDCFDDTDETEEECGCNSTQFMCAYGECIDDQYVCDGNETCSNGLDEQMCNDAACSVCEGPCVLDEVTGRYRCTCQPGYELTDQISCTDIDECAATPWVCSHRCTNGDGDYQCSCVGDFVLGVNGTCTDSSGVDPVIFFTNRYYIRELWYDMSVYRPIEDEFEVLVGLDYDYREERLYTLDHLAGKIERLATDGSDRQTVLDDLNGGETVAIDWVGRNLYFTESNINTMIGVADLSGTNRAVLISEGLFEPRGVAVHPYKGVSVDASGTTQYSTAQERLKHINSRDAPSRLQTKLQAMSTSHLAFQCLHKPIVIGWFGHPTNTCVTSRGALTIATSLLFYTDWGFNAYIGRVGMDGSPVDVNPQIHDTRIVWPNGITVDFASDKLFWTDAHLNFIAFSDFDGTNMGVLSVANTNIPADSLSHPFHVAIYNDWIYWTEWNFPSVHRAKKFSGENYMKVVELGVRPYSIKIFHPSEQNQSLVNPCGSNNGGCSHLCLIAQGGEDYTCYCPPRFTLLPDGVTCEPLCDNIDQDFLCEDHSKCIPSYWRCDNQKDCNDGSDEPEDCDIQCPPRQLHCGDNTCVLPEQICNQDDDCESGIDEQGCNETICHEWEFRCQSGDCVPLTYLCDGFDDCNDGTDESTDTCIATGCAAGYFKCDNNFCIPDWWVCDLDDDCGDSSDEGDQCMEIPCEPGWFDCAESYRCIPSWAVCDGFDGCRDGSDEIGCDTMECEAGYWRCDDEYCIPDRWRCNFREECLDGSDEVNCMSEFRDCTEFEFRCNSSQCITNFMVCDQEEDCRDGDDEQNCGQHQCASGYFTCTSGHCINGVLECDGVVHCGDSSDEIGCATRYPGGQFCFDSQFTCNNTICIPSPDACNLIDDCGDLSDETVEVCDAMPCNSETHFRCLQDRHCIPKTSLCDRIIDCFDESDEDPTGACDPSTPVRCEDNQFTCSDGSCIPNNDVCDGIAHCENGTDELCRQGSCAVEGVNCSQACRDIGTSYACFCDEGFRPSQELHECLDVNECAESNPCLQDCENRKGGYSCLCTDGFNLEGNSQCILEPTQADPLLMVALGDTIRQLNLTSGAYVNTWTNPFIEVVSLDYDYDAATIFFVDSLNKKLSMAPLDDFNNEQALDLVGVYQPGTVAVDFRAKNVYWTDLGDPEAPDNLRGFSKISVVDFAGTHQGTVARIGKGSVKGMAVSCQRGLMYWFNTDGAVIESAWMNGLRREAIVTVGLISVTSIAIDYNHNDVVYFADERRGLFSMNYDGSYVRNLGGNFDVGSPRRIDPFGSLLYWTGLYNNSHVVQQMDKLGRLPPGLVQQETQIPFDLKVIHPLRYNIAQANPCEGSPCSHLCLLTPVIVGDTVRLPYTCACPDGFYLLPGSRDTCEEGPGPACSGPENGGCSDICMTGTQGIPECSCPPGFKLANNRRVCVDETADACPSQRFACRDGSCINEAWLCDGEDDCSDGIDEAWSTCYDHVCEEDEYRCLGGQCIPKSFLCDFVGDCPDGDDEIRSNCSFPECPDTDWQCANYQCIDGLSRCDGFQDCNDLSDEYNCTEFSPAPCPNFFGLEWEHCPTNNLCVPSIYICDGENDCVDNSDESPDVCHENRTCMATEYQCPTGSCIPSFWHCDGFGDCSDGSDEPEDCDTGTCLPHYFRCENGPCIPNQWLCDLDNDCEDSSDEAPEMCDNQTPPPCLGNVFQCGIGKPGVGRCINLAFVCDGISDCEDAEDERQDCPPPAECSEAQFQCQNQLCIPQVFECDHDNDCGDGTDEGSHCPYTTCSEGQFTCNNGRCIRSFFKCDGADDCRDGSDESGELCDTPTCAPGLFTCDNGRCIDASLVCNTENDCSDGSDETEGCGRNECDELLGQMCSQMCIDTPTSYKCACREGYTLNEDMITCRDIDECREMPWVCNNFCENLPGSYLCKCLPGYTLSEGAGICRRDSSVEPYLYFTNRHYIRRLALDGSQFTLVQEGFVNAVAFDVDLVEEKIYVLDTAAEAIYRMNLDGTQQEIIIDEFVTDGEGVALDWIGRKIYWVDQVKDVMEVAELDGSLRKTLLHEGLFAPRAVVVDPREGYVFWTDYGLDTYIGRMGMDGKGEFIKIHQADKIVFPFGLSIDYDTRRLFWVDAHLDYIGYSDFDGDNFQIIPSQGDETYFRPFAVTVFEEFIYWTDWSEMTVFRAHKFTGLNRTQLVQLDRHRPFDLHVYHPNLQRLDIPNPCSSTNGGCSHLCLLSEGGGFSCACPDGFQLNDDNQTCSANCGSYTFTCEDGQKCIPSYYECDTVEDCLDGSDEHLGCQHATCARGMFSCDTTRCLSPLQICDGRVDCADQADEVYCNHNETQTQCHPWEFRCHNGSCIPGVFMCDNFVDCPYAEDESLEVCHPDSEIPCVLGYFKCGNGQCIPETWVCDLDDDCGDNTDEPHRTCQRRECNENWFKCETNYRCIPPYGVCDGFDNCRDNSDEANCPDMTCGPGVYKCDDHTCLPDWRVCDHRVHCFDGSDEAYCGNYTDKPCSESEFRCDSGLCIQGVWVCDDFADCPTGEDEMQNCSVRPCDGGYHKCEETGFCIPPSNVCDGDRDCANGDDEVDCPTKFPGGHYCLRYQFECENHVCIEVGSTCNGIDDCGDNTDESFELCGNCDHANLFLCDSGECIANWEQCDGIVDCMDGSDEDSRCNGICEPDEMSCPSTGECIPAEFYCDRYRDCGDDENQYCHYGRITCSDQRCDQSCVDRQSYSYCTCDEGFRANSIPAPNRQRICENINECEENDPCDHICTDSKGSYGCTCLEGYQEVAPGRCNVTGARPKLVYADGTLLRFFNYDTNREGAIVFGEGHIDKIDVNGDFVYWTDTALRVIKRARIPFSEDEKSFSEVVIGRDFIDNPAGLSIDFSGGNIYWLDKGPSSANVRGKRQVDMTDSEGGSCKVATLSGGSPRTLITGLPESIGDIVVNPRRGVMYWYTVGATPTIEWAWMNGENRAVLVSDRLREPSGLTIDFAKDDNVYFCDRSLNSIEVMRWNGQDRRVIVRSEELRQPVSLEVFESFLYWATSDAPRTLMKMDKRGGSAPTKEVGNIASPTGIKMAHRLRNDLQQSMNPCDGNTCSSLCVVSPSNAIGEVVTFNCQCEDGDSFLDINDKTVCTKTQSVITPKPTPAPKPYDCGCVETQGHCDVTTRMCRCFHGFTGKQCESVLVVCSGHGVMKDGSCKCIEGYEGTECQSRSDKTTEKPTAASPAASPTAVPRTQTGDPNAPSSALIPVVIVLVVILLIVLILVTALYVRRRRNQPEGPPTILYSNDDVKIPTNPEPMPLQFTNPNFASLAAAAEGKDSGLPNDYDEIPIKGSDVVELDMTTGPTHPDASYEASLKTFSPAEEKDSDTYNLVKKDPFPE